MARLTRTFGTPTNDKIFTLSVWIKRSNLGASHTILCGGSSSRPTPQLVLDGNYKFAFSSYNGSGYDVELRSNALLRDPNGWYHVVMAVDTTQATSSNRVKAYINGEQITSWSTESYPSQNFVLEMNKAHTHAVGANTFGGIAGNMGQCILSHYHFIDGIAYTPSAFGETDATTGEWKIKTSPSVTYGNNGFFILKDGNSVTDQSGNGNNWTVAGSNTITKTEDCPSNVFATMNPLDNYYPSATFSNGNNTVVTNSTAICPITGTLAMTSGKYYWEVKPTATSGSDSWYTIGITGRQTTELNQELGNYAYQYGYMGEDGTVRNNSSNIATLSTYTAGDIIGIALDLDNNLIYFYKNGAVQNSGTGLAVSPAASTDFGAYLPAVADWSSQATFTFQANFGNGYFGTTAVSSAGTNASNNGIFEYDVPTGYTALSTKGLNE